MKGMLLWLIYLLTYSGTERALLGSQWFGVNTGFSNEDRIFTGYGAKKLKEFLNKGWGLQVLNKPLKKLHENCMMAR